MSIVLEIKACPGSVVGGEPTFHRTHRLGLDGEHEDGPLERECLWAVGSESAVLVVAVPLAELKRFALDHVSGFLLSLMDGETNVEEILDISSLPRLLALRHLRGLLEGGVIVATYPLAR